MSTLNPAMIKAIELVGLTELARIIEATPNQVSNWRKRKTPIRKCNGIVKATNGAVTHKDLRPDDWESIWPELSDIHNRRLKDKPQIKKI